MFQSPKSMKNYQKIYLYTIIYIYFFSIKNLIKKKIYINYYLLLEHTKLLAHLPYNLLYEKFIVKNYLYNTDLDNFQCKICESIKYI